MRDVRTRREHFQEHYESYSDARENMGVSIVSGGVDQVQAFSGWSCMVQRHTEGSQCQASYGVLVEHVVILSL